MQNNRDLLFPGRSDGKEPPCNVGGLGSQPLGWSVLPYLKWEKRRNHVNQSHRNNKTEVRPKTNTGKRARENHFGNTEEKQASPKMTSCKIQKKILENYFIRCKMTYLRS